MTDQQVVQAMAQQTGQVCGRFRSQQLNRWLHDHSPASATQRRLLGVLTAGLLGLPAAQAQVDTGSVMDRVEVITRPTDAETEVTGQSQPTVTDTIAPDDSSKVITGRVRAAADSSYLPGVFVSVINTSIGVTTDTLGYFRLALHPDYKSDNVTISVGQIGFITQELVVKLRQMNKLSIALQEDTVALGEVIVIGQYRKKSFLEQLRSRSIPKR